MENGGKGLERKGGREGGREGGRGNDTVLLWSYRQCFLVKVNLKTKDQTKIFSKGVVPDE